MEAIPGPSAVARARNGLDIKTDFERQLQIRRPSRCKADKWYKPGYKKLSLFFGLLGPGKNPPGRM
jgi:hypothetical protein